MLSNPNAGVHDDLAEVLLTEAQIQHRLDELAATIQRDYAGRELTLIGILTGSVIFMADLLRRLALPVRLDCVGVVSYHGATASTGEVTWTKFLRLDVRDHEVLVVDDILDTGLTLLRVREAIQKLQPRSLKFAAFLEKDVPHRDGCRADYVAFKIPDKFVVGYGLDYRERYRNLPYVGVLKPEVAGA